MIEILFDFVRKKLSQPNYLNDYLSGLRLLHYRRIEKSTYVFVDYLVNVNGNIL